MSDLLELDPEEYLTAEELLRIDALVNALANPSLSSISYEEAKETLSKEFCIDITPSLDPLAAKVMSIKNRNMHKKVQLIQPSLYLSTKKQARLEKLFKQHVQSGGVDLATLREILLRLGVTLLDEAAAAVFAEVDTDQSGTIELPEFMRMMVKITGANRRTIALEYYTVTELKELRTSFESIGKTQGITAHSAVTSPKSSTIGISGILKLVAIPSLTRENVEDLIHKQFDDVEKLGFYEFVQAFIMLKGDRKRMRRLTAGHVSPGTTMDGLRAEGVTAKELLNLGHGPRDLVKGGYGCLELVQAGVSPLTLLSLSSTLESMRVDSVSAKDLKRSGVSATALRDAGFSSVSVRNACRQITLEHLKLSDNVSDDALSERIGSMEPPHLTPRLKSLAN